VLPAGVGDVSSWAVVSGDFETSRAKGAYRFYVSPKRQAMYQLMRYDIQILLPENDLERGRLSGERLVFAARPGTREPLLCWKRDTAPGPVVWRPVPAGTDAYRLEMVTLIQVLAVHNSLPRAGRP